MHHAELTAPEFFRDASASEADLYEVRLRRQSARTWIAIGIGLLVGSVVGFFFAPGLLMLAGSIGGAVWLQRGVSARRKAKVFESELEQRRWSTPAPSVRVRNDDAPVAVADEDATRLQVELVLYENREVVLRDTLVMTREPSQRVHEVRGRGAARKYVLSYAFDRPSSTLSILAPDYQSSFAMGVYRSTDWETIGVGLTGAMMFRLTPLA
jgi:hypothetical protein